MADIALDNSADLGSTTATSLTTAYTVGSGALRALAVGVVGDSVSDLVTGVTYGGVAMTKVATLAPNASGSNRYEYVFVLFNPASGSNNVVVSASSSSFLAAQAESLINVSPAGVDANNSGNSGTTQASFTLSVTTVADRCWLIGFFKAGVVTTIGAGASTTARVLNNAVYLAMLADSNGVLTPAGSHSLIATMTSPSGNMGGIIVSFKPAVTLTKTLSETQAQASTLSTILARVKTLSETQAQASTLTTVKQYNRTLSATQGQSSTVGTKKTFGKTLATTGQAQASTLTTLKPPVARSCVPRSDRVTGGLTVTVLGSNFVNGCTMTVDGSAVTVTFISSTRLSFVSPAHAAGAVTIVVTNPDTNTTTLTNGFSYFALTSIANDIIASIGGSEIGARLGTVNVTQSLSKQGSVSFDTDTKPVPFSPIRVGINSLADEDLIFIGETQVGDQWDQETNAVFTASGVDSTMQFNRHLVWESLTAMPADQAALYLLAKYAPEFTGLNIASGLPNITLAWQGELLDTVMQNIADAFGGYYYRDNSYDVHQFITESPSQTPDALTAGNTTQQLNPPFHWVADISQVRNRVLGTGASTKLLVPRAITDSILPVQDASLFNASGTVQSNNQRIPYTGKVVGGTVTTTNGDTSLAPPTNPTVAAPSPALSGNLLNGTYGYKVAFGTPTGSTVPGSSSNGTVSSPSVSGGGVVASGSTKFYGWSFTIVTAKGESGFVGGSTGPLSDPGNTAIITNPTWSDARILRINWYRVRDTGSNQYLWKSIAGSGATATGKFLDSETSDVIVPSTDTSQGGALHLSSIPTSGDARTTTRIIYRTKVNGGVYFLLTTIGDNSTTVYDDNADDSTLTIPAPTSGTVAIPIGNATLLVADLAQTAASGFVTVGSMQIRFTGRTGSSGAGSLSGIPVSGVGSITSAIPFGSVVTLTPALTGASIAVAMLIGDPVTLFSQQNDLTCQALVKAIENQSLNKNSDGVYEFKLNDSSQLSQASLDALCLANLLSFSQSGGIITGTYDTLDAKSRVGRPVHVDQDGVLGDFVIQNVVIKAADQGVTIFSVTISSIRFSMEQLLKKLLANLSA